MLYFTSPCLSVNYQFVILNPFPFFTHSSPNPFPLATISLFSTSMSLFQFCLFCSLDSPYKWNHVVFVFLCLIPFSLIPSSSIHAVSNGKISGEETVFPIDKALFTILKDEMTWFSFVFYKKFLDVFIFPLSFVQATSFHPILHSCLVWFFKKYHLK